MAKTALGKGLGALISASSSVSGVARVPALAQPAPGDVVNRVTPDQIVPSPLQPRKEFQPEMLTELMESIREHGIIQPLIVRRVNGKLELIAGERRYRASRELGLKELPVIIREASDKDVLEMALIENLQREGLNPIEEAQAYSRLAKDFHISPFMGMNVRYDWRFVDPTDALGVYMESAENGERLFDVTMTLRRREITGASLATVLVRYPFASARVVAAIYWQALRLRLKKVPFHEHPKWKTQPSATTR